MNVQQIKQAAEKAAKVIPCVQYEIETKHKPINTTIMVTTEEHIEKLKALGVFEAFERNLKAGSLDSTIQEYIDYWNRKDPITFHGFVSSAFYWSETPEGLIFWSNIANS